MRDPKRIDEILTMLGDIWKKFPDLRLGQLISNSLPGNIDGNGLYNLEDSDLKDKLFTYYNYAALKDTKENKDVFVTGLTTSSSSTGIGQEQENMVSSLHQFRNKVDALLGDDLDFTIYEVDEPLPDGTIDRRDDGLTLNIVCTDVVKLVVARRHIGETYEIGGKLYIDYYYSKPKSKSLFKRDEFLNITNEYKEYNGTDSSLDLALLLQDNPHFSKLYSGWGMFGPWFCMAFKPELIQYRNDDGASLHGRKSCAMEDIAREIFPNAKHQKMRFSTENVEEFVLPFSDDDFEYNFEFQ